MPMWRSWGSPGTVLFGCGFMLASLWLTEKSWASVDKHSSESQSSKNDDHHRDDSRDEPAQPDGVLHAHLSPRLERSDVPNRGFAPRVAVFFRKTTLAAVRRNRFFSAP